MSINRKMNIYKFPAYSLPKLKGWHMLLKQHISDNAEKKGFFGANWWDLLINNKLPLSYGEIEINTKNTHSVILLNMGLDDIQVKNNFTGDIYNVKPGSRSFVNNTEDRIIVLSVNNKQSEIYLTKIGNVSLVLLQVEQLKSGKSSVKDSDLFSDFLLMCGISDTEQYLNTVGIESMDCIITKGWDYIDTEGTIKSDFVQTILDQWEAVNPGKRKGKIDKPIPKNIHWIWLRKDINKEEYFPLKQKFYRFMHTWIDRNPGFKYNLWTDNPEFKVPEPFRDNITVRGPEDIGKLLNKLPDAVNKGIKYLYNNHPNVGARSDTLRQAILYIEGGVYCDINDAVCLSPIEDICSKFDYIIGLEPVIYVNNAIIGSRKGHPISKAMLAFLNYYSKSFVEEWKRDYIDAEQDEKDDYIVSTTGPIALTTVIWGLLRDNLEKYNHTLFLPSSWVYPNYWINESPGVWLKPVSIFGHYDGREYLKSK